MDRPLLREISDCAGESLRLGIGKIATFQCDAALAEWQET